MKILLRQIGVAALLLDCTCGENAVRFETLADDCRHNCHIVTFVCENAGENPQTEKDRCVDECVRQKDDASERGVNCAQSYEDMMTCLGTMINTCDDWHDWASRNRESACATESIMYDQECEID